MQAHVRNDVKQPVGLVITSELSYVPCLSLIPRLVEGWFILSTYKRSFGDTELSLIFV
jgi:hypothetical protein